MRTITRDRLKSLLAYDEQTGAFTWKVAIGNGIQPGDVAGTVTIGYRVIQIDRARFMAHRLAWLYAYGEMPPAIIDHKNGIRDDNRISNLRLATHAQNQMNSKARSKSGLKGVYWSARHKKWKAEVRSKDNNKWLGYFSTKEAAAEAYRLAAEKIYGEFARMK